MVRALRPENAPPTYLNSPFCKTRLCQLITCSQSWMTSKLTLVSDMQSDDSIMAWWQTDLIYPHLPAVEYLEHWLLQIGHFQDVHNFLQDQCYSHIHVHNSWMCNEFSCSCIGLQCWIIFKALPLSNSPQFQLYIHWFLTTDIVKHAGVSQWAATYFPQNSLLAWFNKKVHTKNIVIH